MNRHTTPRVRARHSTAARRAAALLLATALAAGCVLAPRATRDERLRAAAAGRAWERPADERALPDLPERPDWRQVLERAFLANGDLEAAWFDWRAALARIDVAGAYPNTNVSFGFQYMFSPGNMKAWDRTTLSVQPDPMQNLSFPTKVYAAARVALDEARAAGERFAAAKFTLQQQVLTAWLDYALLAEKVRIARDDVALLAVLDATAAGRVGAGGPQRDLVQAGIDRRLAENRLAALEAELPQQRAALNALLGRAPDAPLAPPAALPAPRPLAADDGTLIALGVAENPELRALAREQEGRADAVRLARQQYIPDFNPFGGITGSMQQVAGIAVSLPARISMIRGAVREARESLARADAMLRQGRLDREARFVATLHALRDAERQRALLEDDVLPATGRDVADARALYTAGSGNLGELVAAERALLDLRVLIAEERIARETRLAELETLAGVDAETLGGRS
jgi:cobalt-zinc-cadmium efflux system outer membrane protein